VTMAYNQSVLIAGFILSYATIVVPTFVRF
jgi:hypothetical protein